ncbi:MAG: ribulose-phosphate 3-epimerase [Paludibacter sp.]|nr:ribulose-phosphate 3-epimerase [Paludibacter sp.]
MTKIISPSLLSADFGNLEAACKMINASEAEWLHIDVMDGVFVPNISFGFPVLEAVNKYCNKPLDVHLMIVHPEKYITRFAKAGADILTFHYETVENPLEIIELIKSEGIKVGITINPDVPVSVLEPYVDTVDLVLLMTVFAGYGGQQFIEDSYARIAELREMIERKNAHCVIEVDGGVNVQNAQQLFDSGVNVLVAGSAVFNANNPIETIHNMLKG